MLSNGELVTVEWVQHEILESPIKVYNFEVEDFHTYFVGENGVFVHNGCGDKTKADVLEENRKNGRAFETEKVSEFKKSANEVQEQITIRTNDGTKFRIDAIGIDNKSGNVILQEYKSSKTAPLIKNQKKGFRELKANGGVIVGKGKGDVFKKGYPINPGTIVDIIRKGV